MVHLPQESASLRRRLRSKTDFFNELLEFTWRPKAPSQPSLRRQLYPWTVMANGPVNNLLRLVPADLAECLDGTLNHEIVR